MLTSKFQSWQYLVKMLRLFWRPSGVLDIIIKSSAYSKYLTYVCNNCSPGLSDCSSRSANSFIYMLNKFGLRQQPCLTLRS